LERLSNEYNKATEEYTLLAIELEESTQKIVASKEGTAGSRLQT